MYTIEPIAGREAIQKNFVKLPERASSYNGRRVTLNQRFSIIERGYSLKWNANKKPASNENARKVHISATESLKNMDQTDIVNELLAIAEKLRQKQLVSSSQECSPAKSSTPVEYEDCCE